MPKYKRAHPLRRSIKKLR